MTLQQIVCFKCIYTEIVSCGLGVGGCWVLEETHMITCETNIT